MTILVTWQPYMLQGGYSKKLALLYIASKCSALPLTEVSSSEVSTILKKFVLEEVTLSIAILKLSWQPDHGYMTSFRPTQNWQEGEKPTTDLASFPRSTKDPFFSSDYPLKYF